MTGDVFSRPRPLMSRLVADVPLPRFFTARQDFPRPALPPEEIPSRLSAMLSEPDIARRIRPGMRVAITAGSRGVANAAAITRAIADFVRARGGQPFVVPAMGSHGGATAEGQLHVLAGYGITDETMGCPVVSSMEVVCVGKNAEGRDVFMDKNAYGADGIIVSGRVKPHTCFRGDYESGIMKMMAIGLGKQHGAQACHEEGFGNMAKNVYLFGKTILEHAPVIFAVASIENAFDETAELHVLPAERVEADEPALLRRARELMAHLPVPSCDVLAVQQIGKNFSGDGMDPNVTGTFCVPYATGGIASQRVAVLDLSPETAGNGLGVGMSNATTLRVAENLDLEAMYANAITCKVLDGARIPAVMANDREAIQLCLRTCVGVDMAEARVIIIKNSLKVGAVLMSEAYYPAALAGELPGVRVDGGLFTLPFDTDGNLPYGVGMEEE